MQGVRIIQKTADDWDLPDAVSRLQRKARFERLSLQEKGERHAGSHRAPRLYHAGASIGVRAPDEAETPLSWAEVRLARQRGWL